ncbi:PAS domain-containing protein [Ferrovibrio terrae]|jgi:hypothetical protein|uniref:PAS domain-containing protein n=1 Tax=Ferrovibrio terrae TaxID=2594003 RepID=UPI003137F45B
MTAVQNPHRRHSDKPFVSDPGLNFWALRPRAFAATWQARIPPGLTVPPRQAFTPETLIEFLPYMLIIEMDATRQRYRNRLVGTEVVAHAGRDTTGQWFEDIYSEATQSGHHQAHQWVLQHRRPLRVHGTMAYVDRGYMAVESVVTPVSLDRPDYIEQFLICVAYGDVQQN